MITEEKINRLQSKINEALKNIAKEENVSIEFGNITYNVVKYSTQMSISTLDKSDKIDEVMKRVCERAGFTQNILGMRFEGQNGIYEIIDVKLKNRKYPIIAKSLSTDQTFKFAVSHIKKLIGGDKIINRNANLDKLIK